MEISYNNLPQAVTQLTNEIAEIKRLLLEKSNEQQTKADELLTVRQAAELLKLSVPTIYGYVQHREIPVNKVKNRLYFSKLDLIEWVKSSRRKTVVEIEAEAEMFISRNRKGAL